VYYYWVHTSAGGLLIPDRIIRPVVSASTLPWFIALKTFKLLGFPMFRLITRANMILAAANKTQTVRFWTGLNNLDPTTSTYTWADKSPVSALVT
jgi:hypothetical protein